VACHGHGGEHFYVSPRRPGQSASDLLFGGCGVAEFSLSQSSVGLPQGSSFLGIGPYCGVHRTAGEVASSRQSTEISFGIGLGRKHGVFFSGATRRPGCLPIHLSRITIQKCQ